MNERGLADARGAADDQAAPLAGPGGLEGGGQLFELGLPADELVGADGRRHQGGGLVGVAEHGGQLGSGQALIGIAFEQAHANLFEQRIDRGEQGARRHRIAVLLGSEDLRGRAVEEAVAGDCFEEHDADAVPVAGGDGFAVFGQLLGRDVARRAGEGVDALAVQVGAELGYDAEVEDHDPTSVGDHDVVGLDVTVEVARGMQRKQRSG